jgi:hypothetical protein
VSYPERSRSIEDQLAVLLDFNAPPIRIEELDRPADRVGLLLRRSSRSPHFGRRGLATALFWMAGVIALLGLSLGVGVTFFSRSTASVGHLPRISVQIELNAVRVLPGKSIHATVVVFNDGPTLNLTRPQTVNGQTLSCKPDFALFLSNREAAQNVGFASDCEDAPFFIRHGVTRLAFNLLTTYRSCGPTPSAVPNSPLCTRSGPPPLPAGVYQAKIVWSETVPLPKPKPVYVTLVVKEATTTSTSA